MKTYKFHPLSMLFPILDGRHMRDLVDDIRNNGQRDIGLLLDGQILDGRNRYLACVELGLEFACRDVDPREEDPVKLVISLNCMRRHLSDSQRAYAIAEAVGLVRSDQTERDWAKELRIPKTTIHKAKQVAKDAVPEVKARVASGKMKLDPAAKLAALPAKAQRAALASPKALAETLRQHAKPRQPFAAYADRPAPAPARPAPAERESGPVAVVNRCYAEHREAWNAVPPAAPCVVVAAIVRALEEWQKGQG